MGVLHMFNRRGKSAHCLWGIPLFLRWGFVMSWNTLSAIKNRGRALPVVMAVWVCSAAVAKAQDDSSFVRDSMYRRYLAWPSLVKNWRITPRWMADSSSFWYEVDVGGDTLIYEMHPDSNALFVVEKPPPITPLAGDPGDGVPGQTLSPNGTLSLEIRNHDLWLRSVPDDNLRRLTTNGAREHGWTVGGSFVWLAGGHGPHVAWSPDSKKLAVKKLDRRGVDSIPIVHWLEDTVQVEWEFYARAGKAIAQEELWIIDVETGSKRRIDTGPIRDVQLPILGWAPDASTLYFMRATRDHKRREVVAADPSDGSTQTLLVETRDTWLSLARSSFRPLSDGERFLWLSERDGWNHLYLYGVDGSLLRRLTTGAFPVAEVLWVDESTGWIYLTAHSDPDRPYDLHLHRVHLDGHGFSRLTEATGRHTIEMSPSKRFFLDRHSTIDRPPVTELRRADGTFVRTVAEADTEALTALRFVPGEEFVVKAGDGETELWGAIYKPYDFDSTSKYPVIEYISEGPVETEVRRTFVHNQVFQAWAQLGFIVYIVDGRGTDERGKAFQDVRYGKWGQYEIAEHASVLHQLAAQRPYMDLSRVGIVGYSWGGYYALRALLTAGDVYHVGVAIEPDLELTEIFWDGIEAYLGLPTDNPDAWAAASNLALVDSLQGQLLVIQGSGDRIGPMHVSMRTVDALIRAGKQFDMLVVPEMGHTPRASRRYAWRYVWGEAVPNYLRRHLHP